MVSEEYERHIPRLFIQFLAEEASDGDWVWWLMFATWGFGLGAGVMHYAG